MSKVYKKNLNIGPNLPKKVISGQKRKKWTPPLNSAFSNYSIHELKLTILIFFLVQICPKRVFPVKKRKSEYHYWILHIRISVVTTFHLKQTILNVATKFSWKGYFCSKTEKLDNTIEFIAFKCTLRKKCPSSEILWSECGKI